MALNGIKLSLIYLRFTHSSGISLPYSMAVRPKKYDCEEDIYLLTLDTEESKIYSIEEINFLV